MSVMNTWELNALQYHLPDDTAASAVAVMSRLPLDPSSTHDPIIYPGLYAPSGFDMMSILIRVMTRPNPVVELGPVDASCALLMCDLHQPDCPVVYVNEACAQMTGYPASEMLGKNCRFMQAPGGLVTRGSKRKFSEKSVIKEMHSAVQSNSEVALEVVNFKKNGKRFINILAIIPVYWDSSTPRYSVGFMAEKTW
ncbi:putative vivid protein [Xylariaceae sp. FL0804]|nr:putative vivid protein [Xylariaceae sp. FL0804]